MPETDLSTTRLSRRGALSMLLAASGAGLLAACTGAPQSAAPATSKPVATPASAATGATAAQAPTTSPTGQPTSITPTQAAAKPAAAQPKSGGTLRVGMVGDIARIDGHLLSTGNVSWAPFDRLIEYDESSKPTPMLAESWELSPDPSRSSSTCAKASPGTPAASSPATTSSGTWSGCATRRSTPEPGRSEQLVHRRSRHPTSTP